MSYEGSHSRERRRSARHVVENVRGTLHLAAEARIMNMSLTGIAVETDTQLRVGRSYSVSLRHGSDQMLRLNGTVVWCHLRALRRSDSAGTRPVYEAGIQFDQTLTETASGLARILQATAVIAVEKRISGRFTVDLAEPVSLNESHPFEVKTISTVGVLLETTAAPPVDTVIEFDVELGEATLRARGRVAYVKEAAAAAGAATNRLGVEFVGMAPRDRSALEAFIGRSLADAGGRATS